MADFKKLVKNPEKIKKVFFDSGEGTKVNTEIKVYFPERFVSIGIAKIGLTVEVPGILGIVLGNEYGIINLPVIIGLSPGSIQNIEIDEKKYFELTFTKDSWFMKNNSIIKVNRMMFHLFKDFLGRGKIPWYLGQFDVANTFLRAKKYANSNAGSIPLGIEFFISVISRTEKDPTVFYRQRKGNESLIFIGMNNVTDGYTDNIPRTTGSYLDQGINAALGDEQTEISNLEVILRS